MTRRTIAFVPAMYNLAEVTRTLAIARAAADHFRIVFAGYGEGMSL